MRSLAPFAALLLAAASVACVRHGPEWGTAAVLASDDHPAPPQAPPAPKAEPDPDGAARATLAGLGKALTAREWAKVRAGIDGFGTAHPKAGGTVVKDLAALAQRFHAERLAWFSAAAGDRFVPIARGLIDKRVRAKGAGLDDVLAWARKDLPDEAMAALAKELAASDPAVTVAEARAFWDARPKRKEGWNEAPYGSGSFLVNGRKPRASLMKDAWRGVRADERTEAVLADFVEKSGLFEVAAKRGENRCVTCEGRGHITKMTMGGGALTYLCPRCGGAGHDLVARFR